jgi:hypothetical protein
MIQTYRVLKEELKSLKKYILGINYSFLDEQIEAVREFYNKIYGLKKIKNDFKGR